MSDMPPSPRKDHPQSRLKILVVEDELLVGMDLVMLLEEWGHDPVGPLKNVDDAFAAMAKDLPDLGILDVNLGNDETSLPLAKALAEEQVPFVFLTGYEPSRYAGDPALRNALHLRKPVSERALREFLAEVAPPKEG